MFILEPVTEVPHDFTSLMQPEALLEYKDTNKLVPSLFKSSAEAYMVSDAKRVPLLIIGAIRKSFLAPDRELWMLATTNLRWYHIPEGRKRVFEWFKTQEGPIYAHTYGERRAKFAELFGFELLGKDKKMALYQLAPHLLKEA